MAAALSRALVVAITIAASVVVTEPVSARHASIASMLDKYAQHHFDAVKPVSEMNLLSILAFVDDIQHRGQQWTMAAGPASAPERRLVAATFALDAARLAMAAGYRESGDQLIAWGCTELRLDKTPLPAERLWHLATVALLEGADEDGMLAGGASINIGSGAALTVTNDGGPEDEIKTGHLAHAKARFPDEPRFLLAEAVLDEKRTWAAGISDAHATSRVEILPAELTPEYLGDLATRSKDAASALGKGAADPAAARTLTEAAGVKRLGQLAAKLQAMSVYPAIAAEVHLRYGLVALRLAERTVALEHFQQVETLTHEPYLVYLARLLSGVAHERLQQTTEAISAYQSALVIVPRAPTASLLLGAALIRSGRLADAGHLADAFLAGDTSADHRGDAWPIYHEGDYRRLALYLDQLRAALP